MRKFVALATVCALAACGGGGSSSTTTGAIPQATPTATPTAQPAGNQPQFSIAFPANRTSIKGGKHTAFVSSAALSIVIDRTAPSTLNGSPQAISAAACTVAAPCTVTGPAWVTGQSNTYTLTTFDANNGTGNPLDTATVTFTPTPGQTTQAVTLQGIPGIVTITGASALTAGTQNQSEALTVTVKDAAGQIISGPFAHPVRIADADTRSYGTSLTGTNAGTGCTGSCVDLTQPSDTVTLDYGGLAESPVTLTSSGTNLSSAGTATFTPSLNPILPDSGDPLSSLSSCTWVPCYGIDLYSSSSSSSGYSGTVYYKEAGFTDAPYNQSLLGPGSSICSTFATVTTAANVNGETPYSAAAIASPVAGSCTVTVTDGLSDQTNLLPTFVVTYTTFSGGTINAKPGHHKP